MREKNEVTMSSLRPLVLENLQKDGFLVPVAFLHTGDSTVLMHLEDAEATDPAEKFMESILLAINKYKAEHVIIASEITLLSPHKIERAYQIVKITKDTVEGMMQEFRVEDGKVIIEHPPVEDGEFVDNIEEIQQALFNRISH